MSKTKTRTTEPHRLPCKLSDRDKTLRANLLADAVRTLESLELEKKAVVGDFKSRMDAQKELIHKFSAQIKDGVEIRSVDCTLDLNLSKLTATLTRSDTNKVVDVRPMTEEEKQMDFGLE